MTEKLDVVESGCGSDCACKREEEARAKEAPFRQIAFRGKQERLTPRELLEEFNRIAPYPIAENRCSVTPAADGRAQLWVAVSGWNRLWKALRVKKAVYKSPKLFLVREGTLLDASSLRWGLGGDEYDRKPDIS